MDEITATTNNHESSLKALNDLSYQTEVINKKVDEAFGHAWSNGSLQNVSKATFRELLVDDDFTGTIGASLVKNPNKRPHVSKLISTITKLVSKAEVEAFVHDAKKEILYCQQDMSETKDPLAERQ